MTHFFLGILPTNTPLLLYSTAKDIRIANSTKINNKFVYTILIRNFTEGPAVDFHWEQKKICWADHGKENIQCTFYDGGEINQNKTEIISNEVLSPVDMACDWFTNKLYWTDSDTNRIEVVSMMGKYYRKVLFWTDIDQPRAIALAPMRG